MTFSGEPGRARRGRGDPARLPRHTAANRDDSDRPSILAPKHARRADDRLLLRAAGDRLHAYLRRHAAANLPYRPHRSWLGVYLRHGGLLAMVVPARPCGRPGDRIRGAAVAGFYVERLCFAALERRGGDARPPRWSRASRCGCRSRKPRRCCCRSTCTVSAAACGPSALQIGSRALIRTIMIVMRPIAAHCRRW